MKIRLTDHLSRKLSELGQAIDIERPIQVFDGGEVGIVNDNAEKEIENERQRTRGPAAGSRQGAAGSRRSSGEAGDSVGSVWPEWLIPDKVTLLLDSYPGSRVILDANGAWLKVPIAPLGHAGPRALLIVALPKCHTIHPRCWAFWMEATGLPWIGPRHTNYPYGDACAFPQFAGHWSRGEGIRPYVDIHAEWLVRQLHHSVFQRWIGRQMAPFALYALNQFDSSERCHCQRTLPGQRYGECCQTKDFGEFETDPARQVRIALAFTQGCWFNGQKPPLEIVRFARRGETPNLAEVYGRFNECVSFAGRSSIRKMRLLGATSGAGLTTCLAPFGVAA